MLRPLCTQLPRSVPFCQAGMVEQGFASCGMQQQTGQCMTQAEQRQSAPAVVAARARAACSSQGTISGPGRAQEAPECGRGCQAVQLL